MVTTKIWQKVSNQCPPRTRQCHYSNLAATGHRRCIRCNAIQLTDGTWLVPDTRLQAIADAPRCEHGKIDGHDAGDPEHPYASGGFVKDVCPGAPELRALLDALTEEEQ